MVDVFREVDEALREDRVKAQWRRYGPLAIGAAALIVASVAGWVVWQNLDERRQQQDTAQLFALVAGIERSPVEARAELDAFAAGARGGAALLARFQAAGLAAEAGDRAAAVTQYRAIAADSGAAAPWRDLATLLAVLHDLDDGDPAALLAALSPLRQDGHALRHSARELTGLLQLRQGDDAAARQGFAALAADTAAPAGVRARAVDLAAYLDR